MASEAKQSTPSLRGEMDCFASLAMTEISVSAQRPSRFRCAFLYAARRKSSARALPRRPGIIPVRKLKGREGMPVLPLMYHQQ
jgi:hypothetical protein